jgi:hypothetical protein
LTFGLSQEDSYRAHTGIYTRWCRSPGCCGCSPWSTARRCQSGRKPSEEQRCLQLLRKLTLAHTHMMVCPQVYYDYALLRLHLLHCRYFPSLFHWILVIYFLTFNHRRERSCLWDFVTTKILNASTPSIQCRSDVGGIKSIYGGGRVTCSWSPSFPGTRYGGGACPCDEGRVCTVGCAGEELRSELVCSVE